MSFFTIAVLNFSLHATASSAFWPPELWIRFRRRGLRHRIQSVEHALTLLGRAEVESGLLTCGAGGALSVGTAGRGLWAPHLTSDDTEFLERISQHTGLEGGGRPALARGGFAAGL